MRRLFVLIALIMCMIIPIQTKAVHEEAFRIYTKGELAYIDKELGALFSKDNRTFVPVRFFAYQFGWDIEWKGNEQTAIVSNGDTTVSVKLNTPYATVNGERINIDPSGKITAMVRDNRTYLPLRFIAEQFKLKVDYRQEKDKYITHIIEVYDEGSSLYQELKKHLDETNTPYKGELHELVLISKNSIDGIKSPLEKRIKKIGGTLESIKALGEYEESTLDFKEMKYLIQYRGDKTLKNKPNSKFNNKGTYTNPGEQAALQDIKDKLQTGIIQDENTLRKELRKWRLKGAICEDNYKEAYKMFKKMYGDKE